ncbi:MAG: UDP-N-acetylmuramate--L-alanine ligase [Anaerolineae bacterium]
MRDHERSHVHFVGMGGIGMSGLARVLLERGHRVSGSDLKLSALTDKLAALGATVYEGHRSEQVAGAELVVISSAVPLDNPEVVEARRRGIPVLKRAEMLGRLMAEKYSIAVAGTHGKTTTSAMIALILERAGLDPTVLVGGELMDLGTNAKLGQGEYLVAEADEFDGSFLKAVPRLAVVTNIEADHLDYYGSLEAIVEAFGQFIALVPPDGYVVLCQDDPKVRDLGGTEGTVVTYGLGQGAEWRATDLRLNGRGGYDFVVWHGEAQLGPFSLGVPGRHNVTNALAAIVVAWLLGLDVDQVRGTLARYRGTRRRFEVKGVVRGVTVVDDYAHHPTEIRATLAAARERYPGQALWVVFQPHTYSRTRFLLDDFARAFDQADHLVVTAIYAAREHDDLGISSADLVARMSHPHVRHIADLREAATYLAHRIRPGDVLLTLGAGDVWRVGEEVLAILRER